MSALATPTAESTTPRSCPMCGQPLAAEAAKCAACGETLVAPKSKSNLTNAGRMLMLTTAFLGWFCAGFLLSITAVVMHPASVNLLSNAKQQDGTPQLDGKAYQSLNKRFKAKEVLTKDELQQRSKMESLVKQWIAWYTCAMLFGGAAGGLVFGSVGDRFGRTKGMGLAILTYSVMPVVAYFADQPATFLVCWFLACMGMGGMWPNGVALVSEAWSSLSRPLSAGLIGAAANIGIFLLATWMAMDGYKPVPDNWRWVLLVPSASLVLALASFTIVPESPLWQASRSKAASDSGKKGANTSEIFRPPLLWVTIVGIALATVPIVGGWGSANWMGPWAEHDGTGDPGLKAKVNQARSLTGIVGSFLGGAIASFFGRRQSYFLVSLVALGIAQYTFWMVTPTDANFLLWVGALGLFSGIYFGWLPYCLPELFPTRARSAGAGVSFNFGRILTAITVFATGALEVLFNSNYAQIGRVTSLIFAVGMIIIWFAPDTSKKQLAD